MPTPIDLVERAAGFLPSWLAWPMSALSTLSALAGSGLILLAAATGSITAAVWSGGAFVAAAVFWHIAELSGSQGPPGR